MQLNEPVQDYQSFEHKNSNPAIWSTGQRSNTALKPKRIIILQQECHHWGEAKLLEFNDNSMTNIFALLKLHQQVHPHSHDCRPWTYTWHGMRNTHHTAVELWGVHLVVSHLLHIWVINVFQYADIFCKISHNTTHKAR